MVQSGLLVAAWVVFLSSELLGMFTEKGKKYRLKICRNWFKLYPNFKIK